MNPAKNAIRDLVKIFESKCIRDVVISPGSRNAPIADEFIKNSSFRCLSIVDERSAGFFALGMAQQLSSPVALLCTSGSAVLNYAPAIAEAYYQKVPMIVITADRPERWIGQGESQTIDQRNIFANYIKASYRLPQDPGSANDYWFSARLVSEAINTSLLYPHGPVNINVALDEPLYVTGSSSESKPKLIDIQEVFSRIDERGINELASTIAQTKKIMVLTGRLDRDKKLNDLLNAFASMPNVVILTETTGNLHGDRFFPCIDRLLATINPEEKDKLKPNLLITIGDQVISKRIKAFLRNHQPEMHWHIDPAQLHFDTYQCLTKSIPVTPHTFFQQILDKVTATDSNYYHLWKRKDELAESRHSEFLGDAPWSDLLAFEIIISQLPLSSVLQMGNSSPVRYIQLFPNNPHVQFYGNRGTSGIEGCTSTAAGAAFANEKITTLITGDLGFFYDANGLWNNYLSPGLRIIVINNSGGGIFRFIEGPETITEFETYIETNHNLKAELLVKLHGLNYFYAEDQKTLHEQLQMFFDEQNDKPSVLEINTPRMENAPVLRKYFEYLNKGI